jgi:hypothetical protein
MPEWRDTFATLLRWTVFTMIFLGWPLLAWARPGSGAGNNNVALTHQSWIAEHVWIGAVGAFLVAFGVWLLLRESSVIGFTSVGLFPAWAALTWATGSVYTGYALTRAGWTGGAVGLGALVAFVVVMFVNEVAGGPLSLPGIRRR